MSNRYVKWLLASAEASRAAGWGDAEEFEREAREVIEFRQRMEAMRLKAELEIYEAKLAHADR